MKKWKKKWNLKTTLLDMKSWGISILAKWLWCLHHWIVYLFIYVPKIKNYEKSSLGKIWKWDFILSRNWNGYSNVRFHIGSFDTHEYAFNHRAQVFFDVTQCQMVVFFHNCLTVWVWLWFLRVTNIFHMKMFCRIWIL